MMTLYRTYVDGELHSVHTSKKEAIQAAKKIWKTDLLVIKCTLIDGILTRVRQVYKAQFYK